MGGQTSLGHELLFQLPCFLTPWQRSAFTVEVVDVFDRTPECGLDDVCRLRGESELSDEFMPEVRFRREPPLILVQKTRVERRLLEE